MKLGVFQLAFRSTRVVLPNGIKSVSYTHLDVYKRQVPLLFDVAFGGMAATIIFGLTFATGLTLLVTPALYAMFYKVKGK